MREEAIARGAAFERGYLFNQQEDGTPDKERGAIILTRSLGSTKFEFMDSTPEIATRALGDASFVLFGSDGLLVNMNRWYPHDFAAFVERGVRSGWTAETFVTDALQVKDRDNVSAILWIASVAAAFRSEQP